MSGAIGSKSLTSRSGVGSGMESARTLQRQVQLEQIDRAGVTAVLEEEPEERGDDADAHQSVERKSNGSGVAGNGLKHRVSSRACREGKAVAKRKRGVAGDRITALFS